MGGTADRVSLVGVLWAEQGLRLYPYRDCCFSMGDVSADEMIATHTRWNWIGDLIMLVLICCIFMAAFVSAAECCQLDKSSAPVLGACAGMWIVLSLIMYWKSSWFLK